MESPELFAAALGLQAPWRVERVSFDVGEGRLDLFLDFGRGARFRCPEGDAEECVVHDSGEKTWRHLNFFQHQAFVHARVPRVMCPVHGVRQVAVPWARSGSGFTLLFEAYVMTLVSEMPVRAVADLVGEHDTRLWRVLHHYVSSARARTSAADVRAIGMDETSARRGHDYITLFCDLASPPRLLFATEGRDSSVVGAFAEDLRAHGGDPAQITEVACDMSDAFLAGTRRHLPNAQVTFDRYHIAQHLGDAVDKVRRAESKTAPELRGTKYLWLRDPMKLKAKDYAKLSYLQTRFETLATARAYSWRLTFNAFFDEPPDRAEEFLSRWYQGAIRSRLEPIKAFAYLVIDHWDGIVRWHTTKISTGILEAFNSLIQAAKRRARGYRTKKNLIAMAYLVVGKLDLQLAHTK